MRSRPYRDGTLRERLAEARWGHERRGAPPRLPPRRFVILLAGRLCIGHDTQHRTPEARRWRTMLRLRQQRSIRRVEAPTT